MNFFTISRLGDLHKNLMDLDVEILEVTETLTNLALTDGQKLTLSVAPGDTAKFKSGGFTGSRQMQAFIINRKDIKEMPETHEPGWLNNFIENGLAHPINLQAGDIEAKPLTKTKTFNLDHESSIMFINLHLDKLQKDRALIVKAMEEAVKGLHQSITKK